MKQINYVFNYVEQTDKERIEILAHKSIKGDVIVTVNKQHTNDTNKTKSVEYKLSTDDISDINLKFKDLINSIKGIANTGLEAKNETNVFTFKQVSIDVVNVYMDDIITFIIKVSNGYSTREAIKIVDNILKHNPNASCKDINNYIYFDLDITDIDVHAI